MARPNRRKALDELVERKVAEYALNERLNTSMVKLIKEIGEQHVNALVEAFTVAAESHPELWRTLWEQPDPYRWLHEQPQEWRAKVH